MTIKGNKRVRKIYEEWDFRIDSLACKDLLDKVTFEKSYVDIFVFLNSFFKTKQNYHIYGAPCYILIYV
jgi:hypothetical protein